VKRKYWWVFGAIQAVGTLATAEAVFLQFPTLWLVSLLLLLPGSLASLPVFKPSQFGTNWSPWSLWAIAVTTNFFLFILVSFLLAKRRKPN
jgi:hypothetical protein